MSRKKIRKPKIKLGLGPRLREYRESKNLDQQQFSQLIDIPRSTLSETENEISIPKTDILIKIIRKTNITPDELMSLLIGKPHKIYKIDTVGSMEIIGIRDKPEDQLLDLNEMARFVLESNTDSAIALAANIRAFYNNLKKQAEFERRLANLEQQLLDAKSSLARHVEDHVKR